MNKDRVEGAIDELLGSVKRKAGELTGDIELQVEGMAQQAKGKIRNGTGRAVDAVRGLDGEANLTRRPHE